MLRKTDLKGYILHDFIYVCDFLERQNYLISGCQAKGPQGNFWGDGYILYLFFFLPYCTLSEVLLYTVYICTIYYMHYIYYTDKYS